MILNQDAFEYLPQVESNTIDLILTDPPYSISKKSYFHNSDNDRFKNISIDFGYWDVEIDLDTLFKHYYRILRDGGTLIIFYDIWKSTIIKEIATKYKFKQPRVGQWVKNNPVPINSKSNYLSNASEYFFIFVKKSKPTFNSEYDNAIYKYPLCHGKERTKHTTQKPLKLIMELIEKHSNKGDIVLDTFAGSGTTGAAALLLDRQYICIERDLDYFNIIVERLNKIKTENEN